MNEWQPIETAPKDGTEIIACSDIDDVEFYRFYDLDGVWTTRGDYLEPTKSLTFWMPIPELPK